MRLLKSSGEASLGLCWRGFWRAAERLWRGFDLFALCCPPALAERLLEINGEACLSGFSLLYCSKKQNGRKVQEGRKVVTEGRKVVTSTTILYEYRTRTTSYARVN